MRGQDMDPDHDPKMGHLKDDISGGMMETVSTMTHRVVVEQHAARTPQWPVCTQHRVLVLVVQDRHLVHPVVPRSR